MRFIRPLILIFFVVSFCSCNADNDDISINYVEEQLKVGRSVGTYRFIYEGEFWKELKPDLPLYVTIEDTMDPGTIFAKVKVENASTFKIEADLAPGEYVIKSHLPDEEQRKIYNDAEGPVITISHDGKAKYSPLELIHERRLYVECPGLFDTVNINEGQPVLKWNPVKDAAYYSIYWEKVLENGDLLQKKRIERLKDTEYKFDLEMDNNADRGRKMEIAWMLTAYSKKNIAIAHKTSSFRIKY
jgi:hypothetical protein